MAVMIIKLTQREYGHNRIWTFIFASDINAASVYKEKQVTVHSWRRHAETREQGALDS